MDLAYEWTNLYASCRLCNSTKGNHWDAALLRPDAPDYSFWRYFELDTSTGELLPTTDPEAPEADRQRARVTIETFGLNRGNRRAARLAASRAPAGSEQPYRFLHGI